MSGAHPGAEASRRPKDAAGAILSAPAQSSPASQAQILAPQAAAGAERPARRQAGAGHSAGESAPAAQRAGRIQAGAPTARENTPAAEPLAPSARENTPAAEPLAPSARESTPAAEPLAPSARENGRPRRDPPSAKQNAPAAERPCRTAQKSAPAAANSGTTPEQFLSPAGNTGPSAKQNAPAAERPCRTAQSAAPEGGALPRPAGGDDGALPPPFWAAEPETEKPPMPTEPPPERRPDYGRARREALSLLLRSELTGLAVDPTRLEVGVPVVFDTIGSYCAKTGLSRAQLLGRMGALADGCTLRLAGVTLVLTDFHGAGDCRRRRFTQAHELGHILLGHTRDGPAEEQEANRFAGELLMPAPVLAALGSRGGRLRAREIAEWFFVSVSAASAQLARLRRDGVVWDADAQTLVRRCADWIEAALTDPPVTV